MAEYAKKVRTGVKNLHFAILNEDTQSNLAYATPVKVPGLIRIDVNPGSNIDTLYADNKASIVYSVVGSVEVTIEKDSLPDDLLAELLGRKKEGATNYVTNNNTAPYVAIMFEQTYSNGSSSYVKLYKGKFSEPDSSNETKNDSVNFQTGEITAQFVATEFEKDFGGKTEALVMATADEDSEGYVDEGVTWFDYVYQPASALTVTASVSDGDAAVSTTTPVTLEANNALLSDFVLDESNVFLIEDGNGQHPVSLSLSGENKVVTVSYDTSLSATTNYTLVYNLKDVYGQTTGQQVVNFVTA